MSEPRQLARAIGLNVAQMAWSSALIDINQLARISRERLALLCAQAAEMAIERTLAELDQAESTTTKILKEF